MKKFIDEFKAFAIKGNMIDMAVGMIIGAAFSGLVGAMVADLFNPILSLVFKTDFSNMFVALDGNTYATLAAAQEAGAGVFAYGHFITEVINFLLMALAVFLFVKAVSKMKKEAPAPEPTTKTCPHCQSEISIKATKCPFCTSDLEE